MHINAAFTFYGTDGVGWGKVINDVRGVTPLRVVATGMLAAGSMHRQEGSRAREKRKRGWCESYLPEGAGERVVLRVVKMERCGTYWHGACSDDVWTERETPGPQAFRQI